MQPLNLQAEWARLLFSSFADAGLREVVLSPGSRSTPFVLAALAEVRLRCRTLIDERSAAFYALGQGRRRGQPSLLLCTSGSAAAHYYPAVVEARAARVPLLILSSDRPMELSACGANQAIDQCKLFGDQAVGFFDLSLADPSVAAMTGLRRMAAQAFFRSLHPRPGPVQLNARARKPLEPGEVMREAERELQRQTDALLARPITRPVRPRLAPDPPAIDSLTTLCIESRKGLIVCGPAALEQAALHPLLEHLARRTGYPLLVEGASQLRFQARGDGVQYLDAIDLLLGSKAASGWQPELILQIGRMPTSTAWERFVRGSGDAQRWVLAAGGWHDPTNSASVLFVAEPRLAIEALLARLEDRGQALKRRWDGAEKWAASLGRAEALAWSTVDQILAADEGLNEATVVRELVLHLPTGALLTVGNSLTIRHLDRYCPGGGPALKVCHQRGASGIDGLLSGAAGAASAGSEVSALVLGDVSFLHDLGGLAALATLHTPLLVLVLQNDGGRIFEQLPVAKHPAADGSMDHWLTPHGLCLQPAADLYSIPYLRVDSIAGLRGALAEGLGRPGPTLVEAIVPPQGAAAMWRSLQQSFEHAMEQA